MPRGDVRLSVLARQYVRTRAERKEFTGGTASSVRTELERFAESAGNPPVRLLTRQKVERWKADLRCAETTARSKVSRVKNFCEWLVIEGYLKTDPTLGVKAPRVKRRRKKRALPAGSVARLYEVLPDSRARLIVSLMVQEGLRCSSVSWLRVGDVDQNGRTIHVRLKGGHEGELPMTSATTRALAAYLADYQPVGEGPLLRSQRNPHKGLTPHYVSELVRGWFSEAGLKQYPHDGVSAHALRHTALTDVVKANGGDPVIGRDMALHGDGATIWDYIGDTSLSRLREAMEGRDYRGAESELGTFASGGYQVGNRRSGTV